MIKSLKNKFSLASISLLFSLSTTLFGAGRECDFLFREHLKVDVATSTSELRRTLLKLGVESKDFPTFFASRVVRFQYPTKSGDNVYGFLKWEHGTLVSQLFSISNPVPAEAVSAFDHFTKYSIMLADQMAAKKLEVQGGSVFNEKLARTLRNLGYEKKEIPIPRGLGTGNQTVLFKVIDL